MAEPGSQPEGAEEAPGLPGPGGGDPGDAHDPAAPAEAAPAQDGAGARSDLLSGEPGDSLAPDPAGGVGPQPVARSGPGDSAPVARDTAGPTAGDGVSAGPAPVGDEGDRGDGGDKGGQGIGHDGGDEGADEGADDQLALRLEQLIIGSERMYTPFQAARAADVSMDMASRFWRAMGFPDIGQARALTEADVLALRRLAGLVEAGLLSEPMAVQVARSTGQTTARLADWQIDSFLEGLTEPPEPGMSRSEVAYPLVELLLPELEEFLVYVWRRQLAAAAGRVVQEQDDAEMVDRRLAVGFADLVGFTRLTRRLEEEELGELVETFEVTAADQVAAQGGRLIKTLGDEVLFAADDAATAADIGLRLVEAMAADPLLPELRVGIAFGTVTTRMGDVFGNTVNLASRLTSIAPKDRVLVDEAMREELTSAGAAPHSEKAVEEQPAEHPAKGGADDYRFALRPLYQRPVRGLGVVEPWLLTRRS